MVRAHFSWCCVVACLLSLPLMAQPAKPAESIPWFDLQSATIGYRYRSQENNAGTRTQFWSEHQQTFRARLKLDRAAHYTVTAFASNGDQFIASWNPRGLNDHMSNRVYLKQLYLSAKPMSGVELQVGSIPIVRGESTEITTYDADGYITGERLTISRPKDLGLDDITVTMAYFGDMKLPSVNRRWSRMSDNNYRQLLARKKLGARSTVSAEFTDDDGEHTLREGVTFKPAAGVEIVRLEAYERPGDRSGSGFSASIEKPVRNVRIVAGYADIDRLYRPVNGDRYGRGKRVFFSGTMTVHKDITVQLFATRALDDDLAMPNRNRFDLLVRYDFASMLRSGLPLRH